MIERISIFCIVLFTVSQAMALPEELPKVPQRGYSVETLKQPIFNPAEVAIETAMLNNWLNVKYETLNPQQYKGPREHLYYLIDSHVKEIYEKEGQILPNETDLILKTLFYWSERLGVYGGSTVFNAIRSPSDPELPTSLQPPPSLSISMNGDLLRFESTLKSWRFDVPYYFMPFIVEDFTAQNGMPTQFLAISTGATKDSSEAGRSQATLMFIHSPDVNFTEFSDFWTGQLGIPPNTKQTDVGIKNLKAKYSYDATTKLHTEALIWKDDNGAFAVSYSGIDGTYQWNRQHFLDFLNSLENIE